MEHEDYIRILREAESKFSNILEEAARETDLVFDEQEDRVWEYTDSRGEVGISVTKLSDTAVVVLKDYEISRMSQARKLTNQFAEAIRKRIDEQTTVEVRVPDEIFEANLFTLNTIATGERIELDTYHGYDPHYYAIGMTDRKVPGKVCGLCIRFDRDTQTFNIHGWQQDPDHDWRELASRVRKKLVWLTDKKAVID